MRFFYRVLQGLNFLHQNGIIHRDLKPENILISKDFKPKITDFGTSTQKHFNQKMLKTFCGTYEYMAPEIFMRTHQTEKVDIWSLGVLIFEVIHQDNPFEGLSIF